MKFAKYGRRELMLYGGLTGGLMIAVLVVAALFIKHPAAVVLTVIPFLFLFVVVVAFFRDPKRVTPRGEHRVVAPADGAIYDIGDVEETEFVGETCTRIGIFLSVFDCHLNRIPCSGRVEKIVYKKGKFVNALRANECSEQNESNLVGISNAAGTGVKVAVKQIAGAIARRIVCELEEGQEVTRGETFGMIKFGSRTELFIPKSANFEFKLKLGAMVKAGRTVIGTLEPWPATEDEPAQPDDAVPDDDEAELEPLDDEAPRPEAEAEHSEEAPEDAPQNDDAEPEPPKRDEKPTAKAEAETTPCDPTPEPEKTDKPHAS
jgi:phosphatidylserine decarboxylase